MAGTVVVILGGSVSLVGGQGGRAGVPQMRDCQLAQFLSELAKSRAFDSVDDPRGIWPHSLLLLTESPALSVPAHPQLLPPVRTANRNMDLSHGKALFSLLGAEVSQYGRLLLPDLAGSQKLALYAREAIEYARRSQALMGKSVTRSSLQEDLVKPRVYALDTGAEKYMVCIILPPAQSGAKRHIVGDSVAIKASEDLFLMDLSMHGEHELRLASGGDIRATVGVDQAITYDKDGWRTSLTVNRSNNQLTGGIVELIAEGSIGLKGTDIESSGDMLLTSGRGAITITGVTDTLEAERGHRWEHGHEQEFKSAKSYRNVLVKAGGKQTLTAASSLQLEGVNIATPMELILQGTTVTVKTATEEYTYKRESASTGVVRRDGGVLRFLRGKKTIHQSHSESSTENIPAAPSTINAGVLTVVAQVLDLVGVQASLGVFNDQTQVFQLSPVVAQGRRTVSDSLSTRTKGPFNIGRSSSEARVEVREREQNVYGSSLKTKIAHLTGVPGAPRGKVHVVSSEFVAPIIEVAKDFSLGAIPATKESLTTTQTKRSKPLSAPMIPKPASASFVGGNVFDRLAGNVEGVLPILQSINQAFGLLRGQIKALPFVTKQLTNMSWSRQEQRSHVSESQDVPSVVHWGVTTFKNSPALHIKGYLTIDSIQGGSLSSLASEPLRSERRVEIEGSSSSTTFNPVSLSFSWGEQEFKRLQLAIEHANSRLELGGGKLTIEGNADFFGITVAGQNATLAVGGNKTLRSSIDIHEERFEESHSSFSLSLGALLPGLSWGMASLPTILGSGAAIGATSLSFLDVVSIVGGTGFGDSVKEVKEREALPSTITTALGEESSESFHERSVSESSNWAGSILRLAGSGLALGMAVKELGGHVVELARIKGEAQEALQRAGVSAPEAEEILADPEVALDLEALSQVQDLIEEPAAPQKHKAEKSSERPVPVLAERELHQWTKAFVASASEEQGEGLSAAEIHTGGIALARQMRERHSHWRSQGLDDQQAWTNVRFELIQAQKHMESTPQYREASWRAVGLGVMALFSRLGKMISKGGGKIVEKEAKLGSAVTSTKTQIFEKNSKHIFRDKKGHLPDTPSNRKMLIDMVEDPKNFIGVDKYGNRWHAKTLDDGRQIWALSRNNMVRNGGINDIPKPYHLETGLTKPTKLQ